MPRKKRNKPAAAAIVASDVKHDASEAHRMLVNKLSIKDARHILHTEGGELDATRMAIEGVQIVVVAAACAYAIWKGHATVWHLALPMVAEYLVLLVVLPVLYLFLCHEAMRKDVIGAVRLLVGICLVVAISVSIGARRTGSSWQEQFSHDLAGTWAWITDHHMHWAILCAVAGILLGLPARIRHLYTYGPPFVPVGLGCGMRLGVLFLGFFLLPFIVSGTATTNAWILLGVLVLADVLTLWMHLDFQRRLRKLDGTSGDEVVKS